MFNLISIANFEQMQKLEVIFQNADINLAGLQVKEVFQLDRHDKSSFMQNNTESLLIEESPPFSETLE